MERTSHPLANEGQPLSVMNHADPRGSSRSVLRRVAGLATSIALAAGLISVATAVAAPAAPAAAEGITGTFDPGAIISDADMFDFTRMTVSDIQTFLNGKVAACDPAATAPCLKDYHADTHDIAAVANRCTGNITGAANQSAAEIIYAVARACEVNPQALIVTLQKEQGLVTATAPTEGKYKIAMGYGCPDGQDCNSLYFGFSNQVYWAARAFQAYKNSPDSFPDYQPGVRPIKYSPTAGCTSKSVNVQNVATTALYTYTPYTPNAASLANPYKTGDKCSSYGNRNFWLYFNDWFGNTGAGDNLISSSTGTSLIFNGTRWQLPSGATRLVATLSPLDVPATVSTALYNSFSAAGTLSPLVRSSDSKVYLLADRVKYTLDSCAVADSLGFGCDGAAQVPATLLAKIPTSTAFAGRTTAWVETREGQQFLLGDGVRREIADAASLPTATLGTKIAVDSAVLAAIPYAAPLIAEHALVAVRGSTDFVTTTGGATYRLPASLVAQTKLTTWFGVTEGSIDEQSVESLGAVTAFTGFFTDGGTSYLLGASGKFALPDPAEWGATMPSLDAELAGLIPGSGSLSAPVFLRSASSATNYLVIDGERRRVASTADRTAIATNLGFSSTLRTVPTEVLASIDAGEPILPAGIVVRTSSAASAPRWMIDGAGSRIAITPSQNIEFKGSVAPRTVTAAWLTGYPVVDEQLSLGVTCGGDSYFADGGVLRLVTAEDAAEYAPAIGFRAFDATTCAALKKSGAMGVFMLYGSRYFQAVDGERLELTKAQYTAASAGKARAVTVSKYFVTRLPAAG